MLGNSHLKTSILIIILSLALVISDKKSSSKTISVPKKESSGHTTTPSPGGEKAEEDELVEEKVKININGTTEVKCDPREYVQRGYCQKYFTCNRKLRQEVKRGCSDGLFWNPTYNSIHGGVCDYLRNIENETLFEYKKDNTCVLDVAYFRANGECSAKYFYNHPIRTKGVEKQETCPPGLVWSKLKESCELCYMVKKHDGVTPCCENNGDDDY